MQQQETSERMRLIRQKIAELSRLDPTLRITAQELEERRAKYFNADRKLPFPVRASHELPPLPASDPPRPLPTRRVFALDSDYYRNLYQQFERKVLESVHLNRNSPLPTSADRAQPPKEAEERQERQERSEEKKADLNAGESTSLLRLFPVAQNTVPDQQQEEKPPKQQEHLEPKPSAPQVFNIKEQQPALSNTPASIPSFLQNQPFIAQPLPSSLFGAPKPTPGGLFGPTLTNNQEDAKPFNFFGAKQEAKTEKPKPLFSLQPVQVTEPEQKTEQPNPIFTDKPKPIFEAQPIEVKGSEAQAQTAVDKPAQSKSLAQGSVTSLFGSSQPANVNKAPALSFLNNFGKKDESQPKKFSSPFASVDNAQKSQTPSLFAPLKAEADAPKLFGSSQPSEPKPAFSSMFGAGEAEKPKLLVPSQPAEAKPALSGLFNATAKPEVVPMFGQTIHLPSVPESKPIPSLFGAQVQPDSLPENPFQKKPLFGVSQSTPTAPTNLFQNGGETKKAEVSLQSGSQGESGSSEVSRKDSEKIEKKEKGGPVSAIGPGGQKIEIQPIFQADNKKSNPFGAVSEAKNIFSQPSPTPNLFQTATNTNIFQENKAGSFSQGQPSATNIFGQPTTNIFGGLGGAPSLFGSNQQSKPLFGGAAGENSLFGKESKAEQEEEGEEDDDGPLEEEDLANPSLSTGKYDYIQTQVLFKEGANKFREGVRETMENTVVSIEKFEGSEDRYVYVRMPNKCIAFCGKLAKDVTEIRPLNNSAKNVEIKKVVRTMDNQPPQLAILKIQFKEEPVGERFIKEAHAALK